MNDIYLEINDLKLRLQNLENARLNNETISASELLYVYRKIDELEKKAAGMQTQAFISSGKQNRVHNTAGSQPGLISKDKKKFSETTVGKYGVGILASILILLGVFTGVQLFWPFIPDMLKLILLMCVGAGVAVSGYFNTIRTKHNGFWPSVSATGFAIVFIAFASGTIAWGLYPAATLGVLLLLWFIIIMYVSGCLNSRVFYVVSYIGAWFSLGLAVLQIESGGDRTAVFGFALLSFVMPAIGLYHQKRNRILPVLNYIFLSGIAVTAAFEIMHWNRYMPEPFVNSFGPFIPDLLSAAIMISIQVTASVLAVFSAHYLVRDGSRAWPVMSAAGILPLLTLMRAVFQDVPTLSHPLFNDSVSTLVFIMLVLAVAFFMRRAGKLDVYLVTASFPMALCLPHLFHDIPFISDFLISTAILSVFICVFMNSRKRYIAACIFYFTTLFMLFSESSGIDDPCALMTGTLFFICGILLYMKTDHLLFSMVFSVLAMTPVSLICSSDFFIEVSNLVPLGAVIAMFLWYMTTRLIHCRKDAKCLDAAIVLSHIQLAIFHICVYLFNFSFFNTPAVSGFEKGLATVLLLSMSTVLIYEALCKERFIYGILAVGSINCNLFYLTDLICDHPVDLLISTIGVFAAAFLIYVGFLFQKKHLRIPGLITMILYVLKISLLDLSQMGTAGMNVLLLIAGGLVCFAISFLYNKLDKVYGREKLK